MQLSVKDSGLAPNELAAWRGFLRTHATVLRRLDSELQEAHGLPLTSYEVLLFLDDAPGKRLRMSELAESLLLSQSGVTRLVDRLERDGLVERERCESDARGFYAAMTAKGAGLLAQARPTHLAGVRRCFLEPLSESDLERLARIWRRLA